MVVHCALHCGRYVKYIDGETATHSLLPKFYGLHRVKHSLTGTKVDR